MSTLTKEIGCQFSRNERSFPFEPGVGSCSVLGQVSLKRISEFRKLLGQPNKTLGEPILCGRCSNTPSHFRSRKPELTISLSHHLTSFSLEITLAGGEGK